ncbi:hypothetical protein GGI08_006032, partial [Coemansia sp. S2]
LSQKIYARSSPLVDFSDHTLRRLGLGHGDIFAFVCYMYEVYLQRSPVSSTYLAENVYHLYMHTLLSLLIGVGGFEIDHEGLWPRTGAWTNGLSWCMTISQWHGCISCLSSNI